MRFAIPVRDGRFSPHFGRSPAFAFVDVDPETKEVTNQQTFDVPAHDHEALVEFIKENGASVVIAGHMGPAMRKALDGEGIEVVLGSPGIAPAEVVSQYLNDILVTAEEPRGCGHHGHGHDHARGHHGDSRCHDHDHGRRGHRRGHCGCHHD